MEHGIAPLTRIYLLSTKIFFYESMLGEGSFSSDIPFEYKGERHL